MADSFESTHVLGAVRRLNYLRTAVSAAFVCGILASPRLWFGLGRTFPHAPLFDGLPILLLRFDYLFSLLLVVALIFAAAGKRSRSPLIAIIGLTVLLVALDQTRLQPWVYQYIVMLAVIAVVSNVPDDAVAEPIIAVNQLVIACLYFWSGAQKLNWSFQHQVLPSLLDVLGLHLPTSCLPFAGIAVALLESLIGVGLLVPRTRQLAVKLAIGMHIILLLILVAGIRNTVVWPWNIAMIVMVVLLFHRNNSGLDWLEWRNPIGQTGIAVFIICGVMPVLSFIGWWDRYLSAALYSGTAPVAVVHISQSVREQLPGVATERIFATSNGDLMLPFYEWSLADLNVPTYPEVRVYKKVAQQICRFANDPNEVELIVKGRPSAIDGSYTVSSSNCADMLTH